MSGWKEQLHDELDGLPRAEQLRILGDELGMSPGDAIALLARHHVYCAEEVKRENSTDLDPGQRASGTNRQGARTASRP